MRNKLSLTLGLSLLVLASAPLFSQVQKDTSVFTNQPVEVTLAPTPLAANAGLENATATATLWIRQGSVTILVDLHGAELPEGTKLEGWVVDPGLDGGPGGANNSSVSDADEEYGTPFGDANIDTLVDNAAYALSTGKFRPQGNSGTYVCIFNIDNNLSPYDAVVITLESDRNGQNYDPRPGTPVLAGLF